ncbi:hypothetical protein [Perigonia lusca single nucleopolyhedrovirus]|uniref:Uncharacterized protein n=1 Tax=Perigonia lusca single nucleopolyhedrovirus TaxID=1675865 RepID=A0A0M3WNU6_9ABAC|nr:hypothetical protein [Perigonia lusca single nucleopolyhedrovirus]AKN80550.1 hypothetical protein [Perigonia lusca single nucleopolyhedrovirus]
METTGASGYFPATLTRRLLELGVNNESESNRSPHVPYTGGEPYNVALRNCYCLLELYHYNIIQFENKYLHKFNVMDNYVNLCKLCIYVNSICNEYMYQHRKPLNEKLQKLMSLMHERQLFSGIPLHVWSMIEKRYIAFTEECLNIPPENLKNIEVPPCPKRWLAHFPCDPRKGFDVTCHAIQDNIIWPMNFFDINKCQLYNTKMCITDKKIESLILESLPNFKIYNDVEYDRINQEYSAIKVTGCLYANNKFMGYCEERSVAEDNESGLNLLSMRLIKEDGAAWQTFIMESCKEFQSTLQSEPQITQALSKNYYEEESDSDHNPTDPDENVIFIRPKISKIRINDSESEGEDEHQRTSPMRPKSPSQSPQRVSPQLQLPIFKRQTSPKRLRSVSYVSTSSAGHSSSSYQHFSSAGSAEFSEEDEHNLSSADSAEFSSVGSAESSSTLCGEEDERNLFRINPYNIRVIHRITKRKPAQKMYKKKCIRKLTF